MARFLSYYMAAGGGNIPVSRVNNQENDFVGTEVAPDAPRKRRRASKSAGGCVVTSDSFIAELMRRSTEDYLLAMKKAHGLTEGNRSALTRLDVAAAKLHEACARSCITRRITTINACNFSQQRTSASPAQARGQRARNTMQRTVQMWLKGSQSDPRSIRSQIEALLANQINGHSIGMPKARVIMLMASDVSPHGDPAKIRYFLLRHVGAAPQRNGAGPGLQITESGTRYR